MPLNAKKEWYVICEGGIIPAGIEIIIPYRSVKNVRETLIFSNLTSYMTQLHRHCTCLSQSMRHVPPKTDNHNLPT